MAIEHLKQYLLTDKTEEQKRHYAYDYFKELFKERFKTEDYKIDIFIEGQLVIELKTDSKQWLEGFYQALHAKKKGQNFSAVSVIANKFIALWKIENLPTEANRIANFSDPSKSSSETGKINANKTNKALEKEILKSAEFSMLPQDFGNLFPTDILELYEYQKIITNLDAKRIQIDSRNFIDTIQYLSNRFFEDKPSEQRAMEAIHCFYSLVGVWDETANVMGNENSREIRMVSNRRSIFSDVINIHPKYFSEFKKFVETHYIFTNEGSGLTADYYFSRFDEVIHRLNSEYARHHGIFFTDVNLSRFALWFVYNYFDKHLNDKYVVFDPAGGSGNLVTSWRQNIKHKIVSELEPDLLKLIEHRMKLDPEHIQTGFTVVPKTKENKGLNFLDKSAREYMDVINAELKEKQLSIDKPLAFLLNPPYKNTDENVERRINVKAHYDLNQDIIEITGNDAAKERYLAFLGQIVNISKEQVKANAEMKPLIMIFTPTSWLIPRPTYISFRNNFDKYFKYINGFIVTSNEFFSLEGKWPLAFTIWEYHYNEKGNKNEIRIRDFTSLKKENLTLNWKYDSIDTIKSSIQSYIKNTPVINLSKKRDDIRNYLPLVKKGDKEIKQTRYDFSTAKKEKDYEKLVSGFPLKDLNNHYKLKRKCGSPFGSFIGFMDDNTPVRVDMDTCRRMSNKPNRVWFRLDSVFININSTKIFNGCTDNRGYCAYDIESSKITFEWFAITKAVNGVYPLWANQFDLWKPDIPKEREQEFYSLCFAFGLAENRCVVTKFPADDPVKGAPEVFVDNPMCPTNPDSFWSTTLEPYIDKSALAMELITNIKLLYNTWNMNYCKGQTIEYVGLQDEAYFKYFDYPDFLTPYSGLIQIRQYATINGKAELTEMFSNISKLSKAVKEKIYNMLVEEFKYFG